jgi:hypothetical protein
VTIDLEEAQHRASKKGIVGISEGHDVVHPVALIRHHGGLLIRHGCYWVATVVGDDGRSREGSEAIVDELAEVLTAATRDDELVRINNSVVLGISLVGSYDGEKLIYAYEPEGGGLCHGPTAV